MGGDPKIAFTTPFFDVEELASSGTDHPYFRLRGPDSAIVAVFNEAGDILLVRQARPSLGMVTLEFPAGAIESGEEPIEAAAREVLEETGHLAELFQLGEYFHLMMNRTNIKDYLFCGLVYGEKKVSSEPGITHHWVSRADLHQESIRGGYRQLAGLGILHLISETLGMSVINSEAKDLVAGIRRHLSESKQVNE